jgi:hypothetical protein
MGKDVDFETFYQVKYMKSGDFVKEPSFLFQRGEVHKTSRAPWVTPLVKFVLA